MKDVHTDLEEAATLIRELNVIGHPGEEHLLQLDLRNRLIMDNSFINY